MVKYAHPDYYSKKLMAKAPGYSFAGRGKFFPVISQERLKKRGED
jgi:hypothetical protein